MGHRDSIPEDPHDFLRWSRNFVFQMNKNAKLWNIPPVVLEGYKLQYQSAKTAFAACAEEPPPEPDPINGFTIYWDKKKRLHELLCAFHGVEVDEKGRFDGEKLSRRMLAFNREEHSSQWKEFLMGIVRENAARYAMPSEWVEAVRRRMEETPLPEQDSSHFLQLVFYTI